MARVGIHCIAIAAVLLMGYYFICLFQADSAAARSQPLYGSAAGTGQFQAAAMRAAPAGYGQGFTYAAPQGSQAQMNPLLPDFAGLQYPGY